MAAAHALPHAAESARASALFALPVLCVAALVAAGEDGAPALTLVARNATEFVHRCARGRVLVSPEGIGASPCSRARRPAPRHAHA